MEQIENIEDLEYYTFLSLIELVTYHKYLNIVNLDIKPANIFAGLRDLDKNSKMIKMDLGSALILDKDDTK